MDLAVVNSPWMRYDSKCAVATNGCGGELFSGLSRVFDPLALRAARPLTRLWPRTAKAKSPNPLIQEGISDVSDRALDSPRTRRSTN